MTPEEKPVLIVDGVSYEVVGYRNPQRDELYLHSAIRVMTACLNHGTRERPILRRIDPPSPEYDVEKVSVLVGAVKYALPAVVYAGLARPKRFDDAAAQLTAALKALEPEPEKRFHNEENIVYDREAGNYDRGTFYADDTENAIAFAAALNNLHESKGEVK